MMMEKRQEYVMHTCFVLHPPFSFCASFRSLAKAVTEKAELAGHADAPRILRAFKWCVLSEHRAKEKAWKGRADI